MPILAALHVLKHSVGSSRVLSRSRPPCSLQPIALSIFFSLLSQKLAVSSLALPGGSYPGLHCLPSRLVYLFRSCSKEIFPRSLGRGGDDICHEFPLWFCKQARVHKCSFPDELPRRTHDPSQENVKRATPRAAHEGNERVGGLCLTF